MSALFIYDCVVLGGSIGACAYAIALDEARYHPRSTLEAHAGALRCGLLAVWLFTALCLVVAFAPPYRLIR